MRRTLPSRLTALTVVAILALAVLAPTAGAAPEQHAAPTAEPDVPDSAAPSTSVAGTPEEDKRIRDDWTPARIKEALGNGGPTGQAHARSATGPAQAQPSVDDRPVVYPPALPPGINQATVNTPPLPGGATETEWLPIPREAGKYPATPASTIGILAYVNGESGKRQYCVGTAVNSESKNLLLTSAECMYWNSTWNKDFIFLPGYDTVNGQPVEPYGAASRFTAAEAWVPGEWINGLSDDANVGALVMNVLHEENEADSQGLHLVDLLGGQGIATDVVSDGSPTLVFGQSFTTGVLSFCSGKPTKGTFVDTLPCSGLDAPDPAGGPWLIKYVIPAGLGYINGITEFSKGVLTTGHFAARVANLYRTVAGRGGRDVFVPIGGRPELTTGLQIQNLDPAREAKVNIQFIQEGARAYATLKGETIPAGGSKTIGKEQVPSGFTQGSVRIVQPYRDHPAVALNAIANHINTAGDQSSSQGFTSGSSVVLLPLLMQDNGGLSTRFVVQNVSRRPDTLSVTFRDDTGKVIFEDSPFLQSGESKTYDQAPGDRTHVPDFPQVFSGSVSASFGAAAVSVLQEAPGALLEYAGFAPDDASTKLAAPLIVAGNYGAFTGIQVQNPNGNRAEGHIVFGPNVATEIAGQPPLCNDPDRSGPGWVPARRFISVPASGSITKIQRYSGDPKYSAQEDEQFENCRYIGSATIEMSATSGAALPVVAVINQAGPDSSAYEAFNVEEMDAKQEAPLVQANNFRIISGFQIQNVDDDTFTQVTITYGPNVADRSKPSGKPFCADSSGARPTPFVIGIHPGQSRTVLLGPAARIGSDGVPDADEQFKDCTYVGSATVESGGMPIAVIVNQVGQGAGDQLLTYAGQ
jgi:hypothetical protein